MISFSPALMFGLPVSIMLVVCGISVANVLGSRSGAAASIASGAMIAIPMIGASWILDAAWHHSIGVHSKSNLAAIESVDFATANYSDIPIAASEMVRIPRFQWYCEQHIAAPNGAFKGFAINGIRHVYVSKVRHGLRGIAWIPDGATIPTLYDTKYEPTGIDHWYVWSWSIDPSVN